MAFPAWSAVTVQLPAPTKLTVLPLTVQTRGVAVPKVTGFPEAPPVAVTVYVGPATTALLGAAEVNVIVWPTWLTVCVAVPELAL